VYVEILASVPSQNPFASRSKQRAVGYIPAEFKSLRDNRM